MLITRVTLLGHKDHGKSTLIGSMLMATHSVTETRISEAKKISKQLGRQFEPGYILDSFSEEREGGLTIDTTRAQVKYKDSAFEFIDVPGHEELIKNMMSGASYADFALLLISAKPDEGIRDQTKRHLFLAKMMGIKRIVIAVNKMDTIDYSRERFHEIESSILEFLERIGFNKAHVTFVPISAYNSENLVAKSGKMPWYRGLTLLDELEKLSLEKKGAAGEKLYAIMQGVIPGAEDVAAGKMVSGELKVGDKVSLLPGSGVYAVKEIIVKGKKARKADPGQNVALRFDKDLEFDARGSVMCRSNDKVKARDTVESIIFVTKALGRATKIKFGGSEIPCDVRITKLLDTTTGKESPGKALEPLSAARASLKLQRQIVAEPFDRLPDLGRFVLYDEGGFAGIGIITA